MNTYPSYSKLQELAKDPIDLSKEGALSLKRFDEMKIEALNLKMFYSTERVNEKTLSALFELAGQADVFSKMEAMQSGSIMNQIQGFESEQRQVLHTAVRDFFSEKPMMEEVTKEAYAELEKLKEFLSQIDKMGKYKNLVQIGIGGSDLGPRAIYLALNTYKRENREAYFVSNVDPDDAASLLKKLNLHETLVVVVSKSGTTLETRTNEAFFRKKYKELGLDPKDHFIAVTGKGSPMDDPELYKASFYIWDFIGGRYSATSMVGAVMLTFALGMDKFLDFLRGASNMDRLSLNRDPKVNLPLFGALLGIWNRNFLNHPTLAIIPYSQAMIRFPAHLQQLDMESNGKRINKEGETLPYESGPIIWGEPGTNGQHSFYQLIHQGTTIVPIEFIGFKESQYSIDTIIEGTTSQEKLLSNLFAQSIGLATGQKSENPNRIFPGNRPNHIIMSQKLDPYTMGALLSYYENKVAFQGFILNINSFDQEGVQLGKKLANKIIGIFDQKRKNTEYDAKEFLLAQKYLKELDSL
ncbi:MAG: glucose-6-phosphate isomerase [Simkaniaceae bacterium]